ncbi:MAG: RNA-binding protein [Acidobacteria bacterium]|nr:RNA-binding protein [Acidobacteriota bacterium]
MSVKLFVGNLAYNVTSEDLEDLFRQVGEVVSTNVITDRVTGRSRGFGFVEMASPEAAQAAIQQLNDREFEGRNLVVNEARPRPERFEGGFGSERGGGGHGRGGSGGGGGRRPRRGGPDRPPRW